MAFTFYKTSACFEHRNHKIRKSRRGIIFEMQKSYKFVICKHHSLILSNEMLISHLIIKLESKETQKKKPPKQS